MAGLEFGCGDAPRRPDLLGVDIRALPTVAYVCNAWEIDQHVAPSSMDEIFSRHFFEHLTFEQAAVTLESWKTVLKPGGLVTMIVPDMAFHVQQWLNPARKTTINPNGMSDQEWAVSGFWGHQREGAYDVWDVHKSGYDEALLRDFVTEHGYTNFMRIEDMPKNLHVAFYKSID